MKKLDCAFCKLVIPVIFGVLFCGCATTYSGLYPKSLKYTQHSSTDSARVNLYYKFDVLMDRGNKRYSRKEDRAHIDIVAVKVVNNTDKPLKLGENMSFYIGERKIIPLTNGQVIPRFRQGVFGYILYSPIVLTTSSGPGGSSVFPIGIPIAVGNMIAAGSANGNFKREFSANNLYSAVIPPGETVSGLVAFREIEYGRLELRKQ